MGQKTNPIGLRVAVNKDWASKWFAEKKEFGKLLTEDRKIREILKTKLEGASVSKIGLERAASRCRITIFTARPGVVIGRKGAEIDKLKEEIGKMTGKEVYVDIQEIKQPEMDAQLVAENIAVQLERRVSFRRAMKKAVQVAMDFGAEGHQSAGGRAAGRGGNRPGGKIPSGPGAAAHACGPILITDLPRRTPCTGNWASNAGFAKATSPVAARKNSPRRPPAEPVAA